MGFPLQVFLNAIVGNPAFAAHAKVSALFRDSVSSRTRARRIDSGGEYLLPTWPRPRAIRPRVPVARSDRRAVWLGARARRVAGWWGVPQVPRPPRCGAVT